MKDAKLVDNLTDVLWEQVNPLKILNNYVIEIGVWDTSFDREVLDEKSTEKSVKSGVSNAQLMYIHEFGTATIPERPILQYTIDWGYERLQEYYLDVLIDGILLKDWGESEIEKCLGQLAKEMEAHCKKWTQQNKFGLTALKESTISKRRKHSDVPLYDTGQLVKSIRCQVSKR